MNRMLMVLVVSLPAVPQLRAQELVPPQNDWTESVVSHAGGVVRFGLPASWHVGEVCLGREVRLVASPHPLAESGKMPEIGLWLVFHAHELAGADEVERLLYKRALAAEEPGTAVDEREGATRRIPTGVAVEEIRVQRFSGKQLTWKTDSDHAIRIRHLLLQTPWGMCEVHLRAPAGNDFSPAWLRSLTLHSPPVSNATVVAGIHDAEPILGTWKSHRGRLRLRPNSEIEVEWDRSGPLDAVQPGTTIRGTFRAKDDVLYVTWEDGSLLNFRWRHQPARLLLTDHEGHLSQLRRIFE